MSRGKKIRRLRKELKHKEVKKVLLTYINLNIDYYNRLKNFLEDYTNIENKTRVLANIGHALVCIETAERILINKINTHNITAALADIARG